MNTHSIQVFKIYIMDSIFCQKLPRDILRLNCRFAHNYTVYQIKNIRKKMEPKRLHMSCNSSPAVLDLMDLVGPIGGPAFSSQTYLLGYNTLPKQLAHQLWYYFGITFRGGSVFCLNLIIKGKMASPSKVAPFSKMAPGWSCFGSTFFLSVVSLAMDLPMARWD